MLAYLKVKIKSLHAEAQIIRHAERFYKPRDKDTFNGLRNHRIFDVRMEARSSLLAYGFLRGRTYRRIEATCHENPNWNRIETLALKYGPEKDKRIVKQRLEAWHDSKSTTKLEEPAQAA